MFRELDQEFSIVAAGVRSMLNLSSVVTSRMKETEKLEVQKEEILDKELVEREVESSREAEQKPLENSNIHNDF